MKSLVSALLIVVSISGSVAVAAPGPQGGGSTRPAPRPTQPPARPTTGQFVSLSDVVKRVSRENLSVRQNALKVYQANKAISVARGNLLPKLNIWRILSTPFDPKSALGIIDDIAPFLIPGNWFQLKAQKLFYWAEMEGYRTLWANEVQTAKALYIHLSYDRKLLSNVDQSARELQFALDYVKNQENLGAIPMGTSRELELRMLALDEDRRALNMLVEEESSLLAVMLGYSATTQLNLQPVPIPDISAANQFRYEDHEKRVLGASPELKQYHYLIYASQYVKKEAMFSLFGVGSLSRGVAGGVFDNVPIQDGLGFGTPASIAIAKSQTRQIELQREGATEILRRQLRLNVSNLNLEIANFAGVKRRVELTDQIAADIERRMALGEKMPIYDLLEASRNRVQALSAKSEAETRFLVNHDRLMRLTMTQDYANAPSDAAITKR